MNNDEDLEKMSFDELEKERAVALRAVLSFVAVVAIMGMTVIGGWLLNKTKPSAAKKAAAPTMARTVQVETVKPFEGQVTIAAEGVVESQREVTLTAEVTGKLIEVSPNLVAGGQVREDEVLVVIDPADYRTALEQAKAAKERAFLTVADAKLALAQEQAKRAQALRDWKKLGRGEPSDLLARKPQIASAQARVASAQAEVTSAEAEIERAGRNLARTIIRAPFAGTVREESVEVGAVLAPGTMLATVFSDKDLEVELPVRLEDFALLMRGEDGAVQGEVSLSGQLGAKKITWPGKVVRTSGEIDRGALSAGVVVAISPAEGEGELSFPPPGLFVDAELLGQSLEGALVVPRAAVREGNKVVVVSPKSTLIFSDLNVVRSNATEVIVTEGVSAGQQVVLTRVNGAVDGMVVEVEKSNKKAK